MSKPLTQEDAPFVWTRRMADTDVDPHFESNLSIGEI